jgi:hypothetical protein
VPRVMHTVVFLGPSLPIPEATSILAAEYRPPARKGDVYGLLASGVGRVVLVDGVFHHSPSVWQRELLAAVDDGIEVLGASSMGALRAAELCAYGVTGIGTVFGWYRGGVIDGDDEVALHHAPEEMHYRPLSEPLVNIRATLARAVEDGHLTRDDERALVALAKRTYYAERSYRALLASPLVQSWPAARRDALERFLERGAIDIKAEDARSVLMHCARHPGPVARRGPLADPFAEEFASTALQFRVLRDGPRSIAWTDLRERLRRRTSWRVRLDRATTHVCIEDLATRQGVRCPDAVVEAFARQHPPRGRGLTVNEHAALVQRGALVAWLRIAGPPRLGLSWDRDAGRLARRATGSALRADDAAFLAGWLDHHGITVPRAARRRLLETWRLADPARRGRLARQHAIARSRFDAALAQRAGAVWLLETGLASLGVYVDLETAAVLEHQLAAPVARMHGRQR